MVNTAFTNILSSLATGIAGLPAAKYAEAELANSGLLSPGLGSFLNTQNNQTVNTRPKAFLNWILFDEQFNIVQSSSSSDQVPEESVYQHNTPNEDVFTHIKPGLAMEKSGYLHIYVSNETPNINVFFDNL